MLTEVGVVGKVVHFLIVLSRYAMSIWTGCRNTSAFNFNRLVKFPNRKTLRTLKTISRNPVPSFPFALSFCLSVSVVPFLFNSVMLKIHPCQAKHSTAELDTEHVLVFLL